MCIEMIWKMMIASFESMYIYKCICILVGCRLSIDGLGALGLSPRSSPFPWTMCQHRNSSHHRNDRVVRGDYSFMIWYDMICFDMKILLKWSGYREDGHHIQNDQVVRCGIDYLWQVIFSHLMGGQHRENSWNSSHGFEISVMFTSPIYIWASFAFYASWIL